MSVICLFPLFNVWLDILFAKYLSFFYGLVLYLPHRKSDFCVYKTTIETMGLINGGKYKYQLRNDLLLPLSYCCREEKKEFICPSWIINEWKFSEAERMTFYILSRSKEGYTRDRDLFGLKLFMNMRAFTHFIFMREGLLPPFPPTNCKKKKKLKTNMGAFSQLIFMREAPPTPFSRPICKTKNAPFYPPCDVISSIFI